MCCLESSWYRTFDFWWLFWIGDRQACWLAGVYLSLRSPPSPLFHLFIFRFLLLLAQLVSLNILVKIGILPSSGHYWIPALGIKPQTFYKQLLSDNLFIYLFLIKLRLKQRKKREGDWKNTVKEIREAWRNFSTLQRRNKLKLDRRRTMLEQTQFVIIFDFFYADHSILKPGIAT